MGDVLLAVKVVDSFEDLVEDELGLGGGERAVLREVLREIREEITARDPRMAERRKLEVR